MINKHNITLDTLRENYQPVVWDTCDQISNCSDQYVGYYAYLLQQELFRIQQASAVESLFKLPDVIPSKMLELMKYPLKRAEIIYEEVKMDIGGKPGPLLKNISLFFQVERNPGFMEPVIIRNGFLLKCLNEALIKSFDEIENYEAVFVFNRMNVNPSICAFVRFEKKNPNSNAYFELHYLHREREYHR
jgi:hypothetical protein